MFRADGWKVLMDWLKNFDLDRRWNVAMAAGVAIILASVAVKNRDGILIGLGVFGLGYGEQMNHQKMMEWVNGGTLTSFHRVNRPLGLIVTAVGLGLFAIGVYGVIRS
jgi:hypothetical protein